MKGNCFGGLIVLFYFYFYAYYSFDIFERLLNKIELKILLIIRQLFDQYLQRYILFDTYLYFYEYR